MLIKQADGSLRPASEEDAEAFKQYKLGQPFTCEIKKARNYEFHKKWFALVKLAYDAWEPGEIDCKYGNPEKNFDRFRKDLIILAGYYDIYSRVNGEAKAEAKSISFGSMNEHEFAALCSATVDVILKRILTNYTKDDLDRVVGEILNGFA